MIVSLAKEILYSSSTSASGPPSDRVRGILSAKTFPDEEKLWQQKDLAEKN